MTLLLGTGILKPKKVMWSRKGPLAFLFPCGLLPPLPCLTAPFPSGFPDAHQLGVVTVAVVKPFTLLESYSLLSQGASSWSFLTFSLPSTHQKIPLALPFKSIQIPNILSISNATTLVQGTILSILVSTLCSLWFTFRTIARLILFKQVRLAFDLTLMKRQSTFDCLQT